MRKIVITQRIDAIADRREERDALDVRWAALLAAAGLVALPVPSAGDVGAFLAAVGSCDGLLLTGGNDLASASGDPISKRRDEHESILCDELVDRPILGVCRGMQLLGERHGRTVTKVDGHRAARHRIRVDASSRWLRAHDGLEVSSYHAYALTDGTPPLRAVAHAPDGAIEAVEHEVRRILGIGWHPERETPFRVEDVELLRAFYL